MYSDALLIRSFSEDCEKNTENTETHVIERDSCKEFPENTQVLVVLYLGQNIEFPTNPNLVIWIFADTDVKQRLQSTDWLFIFGIKAY